jgi:hypothetical protein
MQHVDTISLIRRLKQQPRHGSWVDDFATWVSSAGSTISSVVDLEVAVKNTGFAMNALNTVTNNTLTGFDKQLAINQKLNESFQTVAKSMLFLENRNSAIQKTQGVSFRSAAKLSMEYATLAKNLGTTHMQMIKYGGSIKSIAPMMNQANASTNNYMKGLVAVQHVLTTNLGLSEEQAGEYSYYAAQSGKNAAAQLDFQNQMMKTLDPEGTMGHFRTITEGISAATADIQIGFGKMPGNLEVAVLKGKALGLTLADLKRTGETLLNIESSIGDELEYQLLSGHRLLDNNNQSLTNKYREAMLQGDMSSQANVLNTILEKEGKTLKNNLFARQQMSKLLGMDEASLSRALQKKDILEKSGPEAKVLMNLSGDEFKQQAEALRKQGDLTDAAYKELMTLQDNRTQEDILKQILETGEDSKMIELLQYNQLKMLNSVNDTLTAAAQEQVESLLNLTDVQAEALGGALITARTIGEVKSNVSSAAGAENKESQATNTLLSNDLIATPTGYGDRILLAGEDTFALNNNDTIVAGTNLFPGGPSTGDDGKLAATMMQVGHMIVSALNRKSKNELFGEGMNPRKWS